MNRYLIPYIMAAGESISAHIYSVEAKELNLALGIMEEQLIAECMDQGDMRLPIFTDESQIENEEDYYIINSRGTLVLTILQIEDVFR